jgi:hypothetical protein
LIIFKEESVSKQFIGLQKLSWGTIHVHNWFRLEWKSFPVYQFKLLASTNTVWLNFYNFLFLTPPHVRSDCLKIVHKCPALYACITKQYQYLLIMGVPGGGGGGGRQPPQSVGQTKPVWQYSLYSRAILAYYKKKWNKFCQFPNIGKISITFRKILVCPRNFWTPKMVHWPKFFWQLGGGGGRPNKFSPEKFFTTWLFYHKIRKVGQICFRPPNFFLPVRPCSWYKYNKNYKLIIFPTKFYLWHKARKHLD